MNFIFKNEIIDYDYEFEDSTQTILFLHGWGGNKNSFIKTKNLLNKFNLLTLTMPTTINTVSVWDLNDYANLVKSLLTFLNIKKVIVICHSFGFRVATILNGIIDIEKLVVTGGAGPKKVNVFKRIETENNILLMEQKRFGFLYKKIASKDYVLLSETNKKTFKNIVNCNTKNLIKFDCPLLLFWGTKDKETKPWIAKKIKRLNNAKLYFTDSDHFAYINKSAEFNHEVLRFLL